MDGTPVAHQRQHQKHHCDDEQASGFRRINRMAVDGIPSRLLRMGGFHATIVDPRDKWGMQLVIPRQTEQGQSVSGRAR